MKHYLLLATLLLTGILSYAQKSTESVSVPWPVDAHMKLGNEIDEPMLDTKEYVPAGQTVLRWTLEGEIDCMKHVRFTRMTRPVEIETETIHDKDTSARVTILEINDTAQNKWVLYKVEGIKYYKDAAYLSELCYGLQGNEHYFVCTVRVHQKALNAAFIEKWSAVLKAARLTSKAASAK